MRRAALENSLNAQGCTPLMLAAFRGHDTVVARLLALKADVGLQSLAYGGHFATHWACCGKHASALALLLDAGASFNARTDWSWTPLMKAVSFGATDCVALLIARGGDALDMDTTSSTSTPPPREPHSSGLGCPLWSR